MIDYHFKTTCCEKPVVTEVYKDVPLRFEYRCPYGCESARMILHTYLKDEWMFLPGRAGDGRGRQPAQAPARPLVRVPGTLVPSIAEALGHGVSRRSRCSHLYPRITSAAGDPVCANCGSQ